MGLHTVGIVSDALDRFFEHLHRFRPVNATFIGDHRYDALLPDWSEAGLIAMDSEMHAISVELATAFYSTDDPLELRAKPALLDARLARNYVDIQIAEHASRHGPRGNPSLWSGEAVFSIISLMVRDALPLTERLVSARARMDAIPTFLREAESVLEQAPIPAAWIAKARRDCEGAEQLLTKGVGAWLLLDESGAVDHAAVHASANRTIAAFERFSAWLGERSAAGDAAASCGAEFFDLLLTRGHECTRTRDDLLADARAAFAAAKARLDEMTSATAGTWDRAQSMLAADHAAPEGYLDAFARTWARSREHASRYDVVTWPEWPIRYVPFPASTRHAAPLLYYLYYRAPSAYDPTDVYDYVVPPLPDEAEAAERHLRIWNQSAVTLNHVVHHGGIGHHVQNWHAYNRARTRIGKVAAVDCANRIAMFCGGTMAEGWACYATELMEELDFLSPLERLSEQHSRMRFLARAIVDIELHQGTMSFADAIQFYEREVGMQPDTARAETVKNGMYPCTAIMYWLGAQGILDLRAAMQQRLGHVFSLKRFHDTLLGYGSIPIPLIARMMTADEA
jgi:uncharacterized protein (DUF885 family)